MKPQVYSEIGRLRKVLVHRPGKEIDIIVPEMTKELLMEDILFGERAQQEHDQMCEVFHKFDAETYDAQSLLIETLMTAKPHIIDAFLDQLQQLENFSDEVFQKLKRMTPSELGNALIYGILHAPNVMTDEKLYFFKPVPNFIFARDPVITVYDKILASAMAEPVRQREAKILTFIFRNHTLFGMPQNLIDLHELSTEKAKITLEGGDFLVVDHQTIFIGLSSRTTLSSIKMLAGELKKLGVAYLFVAKLPPKVSFIHLDTVFTRISQTECIIYPPLFAKESPSRAEISFFDLTGEKPKEKKFDTIFEGLAEVGINLTPIYCGGKENLINQKREQWTQGANAFCIAPGIIMTYARNVYTAKELSKAGYLVVNASEVLTPTFEVEMDRKLAILIQGDELCRARGGPRCLTQPLIRDKF
ncbi:MAG: hypothetical protein A2X86_20025 [Bdellovibrionales bacterium GWA2_49_15]|nr:MAG: hypothetical protein A2X86_20025 [Bdellovibrionales bacterium GWA2_49_15]HAZ11398.1 hypothetical protein [Bdellovibrionales bacterium]